MPWTHLEPGEFMTNAGIWAAQIAAGDVVRDVYGDAANAPIALEDIAAVAARILVDGGHAGASYELTGPESLTRRERVRADRRGAGPRADLRRAAAREPRSSSSRWSWASTRSGTWTALAQFVAHPQRGGADGRRADRPARARRSPSGRPPTPAALRKRLAVTRFGGHHGLR